MNLELAKKIVKASIEYGLNCDSNGYVKWSLENNIIKIDKSLKKEFWYKSDCEEFFDIDLCILTALNVIGFNIKELDYE